MIYGDEIRLRPVEKDDLPRFVVWLNDPEVRRGLSFYLPMSTEDEQRWFEALGERDPAERPFSIDASQDGGWVHIGSCGLFSIDFRNRSAELGILIGEKRLWGRGLGSDVLRTLLRHAFDTLNMHRVFLRVFAHNARAIKAYEGVGFVAEGRLREDHFDQGSYEDTLLYSILREEWKSGSMGEA